MMSEKHIIQKQIVEVTFASDQNAFRLKENLCEVCTAKLLPAMDKLFDTVAKGKILRTDRLVIDVGELSEHNWETVLIERVISQLSHCINEAMLSWQFVSPASPPKYVTALTMDTATRNNLWEVKEQDNIFNATFYFLEHGRLPWYISAGTQASFNDALLSMLAQPVWFEKLIDMVRGSQLIFDRLLYQANENVMLSLVAHAGLETDLVISLKNFLSGIINKLKAASGLAITDDGTKYVAYSILLKAMIDSYRHDGVKIDWDQYFKRVIFLMVKKFSGNGISRLTSMIGESPFENFRENALACVQQFSASDLGEKQVAVKSHQKNDVTDLKEDGLFITNAGLVLLHPFLPMLFENTGYIYNKAWTSDEHKHRALALMQYIVTGKDEFPEFDLALNKLLIGYAMNETLPAEIHLSEFEKQEACDVLNSVVRHWAALKNTSIEGLQSSFLKREGKLLLTDSGWHLDVEHKSMDILLNRLPWSFSIVKTPWMNMKLMVEWNT